MTGQEQDALATLHREIDASNLHPIAKSFLLALRRGSDGYELPREAATVVTDQLFVQAKSGNNLGPIIAALLYFAKGYENELNSPMVGVDLGQAMNDLAERLRTMNASELTAQRNQRTALGDAPPPPSRTPTVPPANAPPPSFKPWEILRKK